MRRAFLIATALALPATGAHGADGPAAASTIQVLGIGEVMTPPDLARVTLDVRGEGATVEAAVADLNAKRARIEAAVGAVAQATVTLATGTPSVEEARSKECDGEDYNDNPRLSKGPCAVLGYVASVGLTLQVTPPGEAGAVVAQAGRAGGSGASVSAFELKAPRAAAGRATAAAVADARTQAEAIAVAAGGRLGRLLRVADQCAFDEGDAVIVVTGNVLPPPPELEMGAPLRIGLTPKPISTTARLTVTFEILPAAAR